MPDAQRPVEVIPRRHIEHLAVGVPVGAPEMTRTEGAEAPPELTVAVLSHRDVVEPAVRTTPLAPGQVIYQMPRPGDFMFTHEDAWTSRLIQIGQAIRFRGKRNRYAYWNHVALFVDDIGTIVEALGTGVSQGAVTKYNGTQRTIVRIDASAADREEAATFAKECVGARYGGLTIISIALSLLTGTKLSFSVDGQFICSGLVARALERTTAIFRKEPSRIMPAELAEKFNVPRPKMRKGRIP